jgi:hypothetical protein
MSFTMTRTVAETFSLTSAKYLASKVTADMRRCSQIHGQPSESQINDYGTELALLLKDGYLEDYEFGFEKDGKRVLSFYYKVVGDQLAASDDRPGKIFDGPVLGSQFFNFIHPSAKWGSLSQAERDAFNNLSPISRFSGSPPADGNGYWSNDLSYMKDGVALQRKTFRPF